EQAGKVRAMTASIAHRTVLFVYAMQLASGWSWPTQAAAAPELVVTNNLTLGREEHLSERLVIRASHLTVDGNGATLVGPGQMGDVKSLENAGIGVLVEGAVDVTIKNLNAHGFGTGLVLRNVEAAAVSDCDFSDNYHNP